MTIVQLTGDSLGLIGTACSVARTLQPAMVVVEDVDLIAEDRGMHPGHHPLLFQLLNEMDGLAEDVDVVFLLTTNRADAPGARARGAARAGRPGSAAGAAGRRRADPAVPALPRTADRRREPPGRRDRPDRGRDGVVPQGAAAPRRPDRGHARATRGELTVTADQLDAALDELLDTRNAMTRVLLGGGTR